MITSSVRRTELPLDPFIEIMEPRMLPLMTNASANSIGFND
jgi:hypothetical protein